MGDNIKRAHLYMGRARYVVMLSSHQAHVRAALHSVSG